MSFSRSILQRLGFVKPRRLIYYINQEGLKWKFHSTYQSHFWYESKAFLFVTKQKVFFKLYWIYRLKAYWID